MRIAVIEPDTCLWGILRDVLDFLGCDCVIYDRPPSPDVIRQHHFDAVVIEPGEPSESHIRYGPWMSYAFFYSEIVPVIILSDYYGNIQKARENGLLYIRNKTTNMVPGLCESIEKLSLSLTKV